MKRYDKAKLYTPTASQKPERPLTVVNERGTSE